MDVVGVWLAEGAFVDVDVRRRICTFLRWKTLELTIFRQSDQ